MSLTFKLMHLACLVSNSAVLSRVSFRILSRGSKLNAIFADSEGARTKIRSKKQLTVYAQIEAPPNKLQSRLEAGSSQENKRLVSNRGWGAFEGHGTYHSDLFSRKIVLQQPRRLVKSLVVNCYRILIHRSLCQACVPSIYSSWFVL
jgi:hypothetical protein